MDSVKTVFDVIKGEVEKVESKPKKSKRKSKDDIFKEKLSMKEFARAFNESKQMEFIETWEKAPYKVKLETYVKMMEYSTPKLSAVKVDEAREANSAQQLLKVVSKYGS